MRSLPRSFVEKIRSLNFDSVKEAVGEYPIDKEIDALLIRRDLIIANLDKRIAELGEAAVLY